MSNSPNAHDHHHSHGPANRSRRILETTAPLFVEEPVGDVRGGTIVLHDIFGLTGSVEKYCRHAARDGLLAVAPYHYYDVGGREYGEPARARGAARLLDRDGLHDDLVGALDYLVRRRGLPTGEVSVVGFGMGADLAHRAAAELGIVAGEPQHMESP